MKQTITRRVPCALCDGKGIMHLRFVDRWYPWCRPCKGTGMVEIRVPVLHG